MRVNVNLNGTGTRYIYIYKRKIQGENLFNFYRDDATGVGEGKGSCVFVLHVRRLTLNDIIRNAGRRESRNDDTIIPLLVLLAYVGAGSTATHRRAAASHVSVNAERPPSRNCANHKNANGYFTI